MLHTSVTKLTGGYELKWWREYFRSAVRESRACGLPGYQILHHDAKYFQHSYFRVSFSSDTYKNVLSYHMRRAENAR